MAISPEQRVRPAALLGQLLRQLSWRELLHHPWRNAAAAAAVMLGVALSFSTHLINASALSEFSSATRAINGQSDLELRAVRSSFDEAIFERVASQNSVAVASPVLELSSFAVTSGGKRVAVRVLGVDALVVAQIAPSLMPVPGKQKDQNQAGSNRFALFTPGSVFLNPAARAALGLGSESDNLKLQSGVQLIDVSVAGSVAAGGAPLAVMDIGAAQELFDKRGQLSRIDIRLAAGADRTALVKALDLPASVTAAEPDDAAQRVSNLSRAYRVNLTVLALVALFTGAFLVFSVLSLSVAKRAQQFALLGVLGLTGRERLALVMAESAVLGVVGSALGLALGTALAALALRVLGGDLGGGYFAGVAPTLQFASGAALAYGALGVAAACVGGWWPARAAQKLAPAQTLKGLGATAQNGKGHWLSFGLITLGAALAYLPPVAGIPLAAYASVALLLVGGITALPYLIALLYDALSPFVARALLPMLAIERARRVRESAAVAVSGVVASLSLAVALTVMVASFRTSVTQWLDVILPADLYARTASSTTAGGAGEGVFLTPEFVAAITAVPGIARVSTLRTTQVVLDAKAPAVVLIARDMGNPANALPMVGEVLPAPPGTIGIYVSEAMVDLYGARLGAVFEPFSKPFSALAPINRVQVAINSIAINSAMPAAADPQFYVSGIWRDYSRQFGAVAIAAPDFVRLTGDTRISDAAIWLTPNAIAGAKSGEVESAVRAAADKQAGAGGLIEFASTAQIRAISLKIFDRSFAVTYWLQGVAIAIGLFGIAASFSAQVLARRKEFGLLVHLGLTRRQILGVVAGEGAAWTLIGSVAGLGLGLAVSLVLVHVVNPQSFHWTMDLVLPWLRLLGLCALVVAAGTFTAWLAGRAAASKDAVLAVKEDW